MNQWRSPTAEHIYRDHPAISVRSAGTNKGARRLVSAQDLHWADVVLVMENKHKSRLTSEFASVVEHKPVHVLDIPDEYKFMDPDLIEELKRSVGAVLQLETL